MSATGFSFERSRVLMERSRAVLPGGVNSPARAYRAVGGDPVVLERGAGALVYDVDGNEYVDYLGSFGPLILGHAHPAVVAAVGAAAALGTSFGAPTEAELELGELVVEALPSIELVRFVNSGTEAVMSALRLARAATGRDLIVKFEGCYHGHSGCPTRRACRRRSRRRRSSRPTTTRARSARSSRRTRAPSPL